MRVFTERLEGRLLLSSTHFAAVGDYGWQGQPALDVSNLIHSWNPDYIITLGDNNYDSGSASTIDQNIGQYYHDYIGGYTGSYGAGSPTNRFYPALGNHDWITRSGSPALPTVYLNYFQLPGNERYFTFTQGPVQFFAIDSGDTTGGSSDGFEPDGYTSSSVQALWLQSQLASSIAPWKVVYFHHPPYSSGSHGNTPVMQWPFAAWGADVVLTGHEHDYERFVVGGLPYIVAGLGGKSITTFGTPVAGSQLRYSANYGALLADADDTSLKFQFINRASQTIDIYTLRKVTPLNTIALAATDPSAAEPSDGGLFTFTRTGDTTNSLVTGYTITGTATNGTDYTTLTGTVTFAAGSATALVPVSVSDDALVEGSETVILTLTPSAGYNMGAATSATVTIADNDSTNATLIPTGAVWKYLDNGSDQGTGWRAVGFNDVAWASGPAQLGFGDGDEATVVNGGPSNARYLTTYFRKSFSLADASLVTALSLRILRDDGAVVYLNGTEVFRTNMPTGTITYTTLAASNALAADETTTYYSSGALNTALLGTSNVIAVEVHQINATSSDISFNFELSATLTSKITGKVYVDRRSDGAFGGADTGIGGATVYLDTNNNGTLDVGETSQTTSASGDYTFANLGGGNYVVRQVTPAGYVQTSGAGGLATTLTPGTPAVGKDFGNFPTTIVGTGGNDNFYARSGGGTTLQVYLAASPAGLADYAIDHTLLETLAFSGQGGDDTLTLNYSAGLFAPDDGMTFDAGTGAADRVIAIAGSSPDNVLSVAPAVLHHGLEAVNLIGVDAFTFRGGLVTANADLAGASLSASDGAAVVLAASQHLSALNLADTSSAALSAGGKFLTTSALSLSGGALLDLSDGSLALDYSGASPRAAIAALIASARNGYDANIVTNWSGKGITSSAARANSVAAGFDLYSLGIIDNASLADPNIGRDTYTVFRTQTCDATTVLVRYTYAGDADLNGFVDGDDYALIDNAYNNLIPNFGWMSGDFNYDSNIDGDDYALIDSGFLFQASPIL